MKIVAITNDREYYTVRACDVYNFTFEEFMDKLLNYDESYWIHLKNNEGMKLTMRLSSIKSFTEVSDDCYV